MATLRELADKRGLKIGAAVAAGRLRDDPEYRQVLAREYNQVVAENAMKFGPLRPARDRFDWAPADDIVGFAEEYDMLVRGHTLAWYQQLPKWLTDDPPMPAEFRHLIRDHIQAAARHFADRVFAWDVVNEAIVDDGTPRRSLLEEKLGTEWVADAFQWARQADPTAKLFYNDYGAEVVNPKSDGIYRMVGDFLRRGVPIDGVGLQCHFALDKLPDLASMRENIKRLRGLGLAVHITELDVRVLLPATPEKLAQQATFYANLLKLYLDETAPDPASPADAWRHVFTTWGFTDRSSWVPNFFKGYGTALPFDESCRPKPAYHAMAEVLAGN